MSRRLILTLWVAALALTAAAAGAAPPPRAAAEAAPAPAAPATRPAPRPSAPAARAAAAKSAPTSAAAPRRTLEDIHIEGEVPVPQVLFVTARDQRRIMEFQHRRHLPTTLDAARRAPIPERIVVADGRPDDTRKESPR